MVNIFFGYRTAIQEGSDYFESFESSTRKLHSNDLVWQSSHIQQQILLYCGINLKGGIAQKQNEAYGEICFQIPTKISLYN